MSASGLRPPVQAARQRLAEGYEQLKIRHQAGCCGVELCTAVTDLRDEVLLSLYQDSLAALGEEGDRVASQIALVAHGGYGRRTMAPFSDVDVMILRAPGRIGAIEDLVRHLLSNVFDAGLDFAHSVRTTEEACRLSLQDATICTSLMEARLLTGNAELFDGFLRRFQTRVRRRAPSMVAAIENARQEERRKFGETIYMLEPNVKRSPGGLRGLNLIRWIGLARYGTREPEALEQLGVLAQDDCQRLGQATEFLLWLRERDSLRGGETRRRAHQGGAAPHRRVCCITSPPPACSRSSSSCANTFATPSRSAALPRG